jgi:PAS domain S-box-containing protein
VTPLRVLLVEDSEDDALLAVRELARGGYKPTWERVQDRDAMREALRRTPWDVVISDWSMPQFNALAALAVVKESGIDVPFIIASGTIGEETAVEALHAGADDFLLKGNLARMNPAVERVLRESKRRDAHRQASTALRKSEDRFAKLAASGIIGVVVADVFGKIAEANDAFVRMVGYSREELVSGAIPGADLIPSEWRTVDRSAPEPLTARAAAPAWEKEFVRKDGSRVPALIAATMLDDQSCICVIADLTERKGAEAALRRGAASSGSEDGGDWQSRGRCRSRFQ